MGARSSAGNESVGWSRRLTSLVQSNNSRGDEMIVGGRAEIIQLQSLKSAGGVASSAPGEQSPRIFVSRSRMIWVTLLERCRGC